MLSLLLAWTCRSPRSTRKCSDTSVMRSQSGNAWIFVLHGNNVAHQGLISRPILTCCATQSILWLLMIRGCLICLGMRKMACGPLYVWTTLAFCVPTVNIVAADDPRLPHLSRYEKDCLWSSLCVNYTGFLRPHSQYRGRWWSAAASFVSVWERWPVVLFMCELHWLSASPQSISWPLMICDCLFFLGMSKVICVPIYIWTLSTHSGETDEANCSWLHPVWPPPKRSDQDSTFCMVSRASTDLIFCIHRDFDVRNNVCKPRRLVCECCRDISAWKSRVMKPTVLGDEANCWGALA